MEASRSYRPVIGHGEWTGGACWLAFLVLTWLLVEYPCGLALVAASGLVHWVVGAGERLGALSQQHPRGLFGNHQQSAATIAAPIGPRISSKSARTVRCHIPRLCTQFHWRIGANS